MAVVKAIVAIVVGYLSMAVTVFVSFTAAYLIMGPDRAYKPGSYDVSTLWLASSIVLGFFAAIIGGLVCALVAGRGSKVPMILAGLALVLGLILAIGVIMAPEAAPEVRPPDVGLLEAMSKSKQPGFAAVLNAFIGAVGVIIGARLCARGAEPLAEAG